MNIVLSLYRYALPLRQPLAVRQPPLTVREGLLVRLTDNSGNEGWGDAAPLPGYSRETLGAVQAALQAVQLPEDETCWSSAAHPDGPFARWLDAARLPPSARFGLETAAWHLVARRNGITMPHLAAPHPWPEVRVNGLLLGAQDEILTAARRFRERGYAAAKLKVGRQAVEQDVSLVRAVADMLGPDVALRLDANRAWTFNEALDFADRMEGVYIEYIEEPLADPEWLMELAAATGLPIALDETLVALSPGVLDRHAYVRAVILKPTLLGGLIPALRMARRAQDLGMTPVVSAAFESGVGLRALVVLAAVLEERPVPAGLDTYRWLADDVLQPRLDFHGPVLHVASLMQQTYTVRQELLDGC